MTAVELVEAFALAIEDAGYGPDDEITMDDWNVIITNLAENH